MKRIPSISVVSLGATLTLGLGLLVMGLLALPATTAPMPAGIAVDPSAESQNVEGRVVRVIDTREVEIGPGQTQPVQRLLVELLGEKANGQQIEVEHGLMNLTQEHSLYRAGDTVLVMLVTRPDGSQMAMITGYVRTRDMALLVGVFVVFTVLVSGWKGLRAMAGLAVSFVVVMGFVLPQILSGRDPVVVSIVGSFVLLSVTLYLTQGWTLKTHAALFGILISLVITGIVVSLATDLTRLTGYGSEDAFLLQASGSAVNLRGLLMAGMMIGALGVLDDVIIGQASAVTELSEANPRLGWRELYRRAMNVGHDHIAATVNTLVLAYVGAAMPLLLLFHIYPEPWIHTLNRDLIAEEIVRSLAGSLSLIAAVPITTLIASLLRATQHLPARHLPANGRSRETRSMNTFTIVYDNHALDQKLKPDHGFACLIEAAGQRILFDTGADGPTLIYNMTVLAIDPRQMDTVVLSHEHADHTGGLNALLNLNDRLTVHIPAAFTPDFKSRLNGRARVVEVDSVSMIADGIRLFTTDSGRGVEQALVIEEAGQLILVTGCAHPGIVPLVRRAQGWGQVKMILGGFHLKDMPDQESRSIVEALRQLGVTAVAPAHCTGEQATWAFRSVFGAGFILTGAGATIPFTGR